MYILYGLPKGSTKLYDEVLLCTVCKTLQDVDKIIGVAKLDGFHSFRTVKEVLGSMPDFIGAVTVRKLRKKKRR